MDVLVYIYISTNLSIYNECALIHFYTYPREFPWHMVSTLPDLLTLAEFNLERTLLYMMLPRTTTFLKMGSPVPSYGSLDFCEKKKGEMLTSFYKIYGSKFVLAS